MTNQDIAVEISNISKTYKSTKKIPGKRRWLGLRQAIRKEEVKALDDVSLDILRGEILGLLGPNGAGKTTLTKIIATLILPDAGTARVFGTDSVKQPGKARAKLGLVTGGERSVYWKMSGLENLIFFGQLYRMPKKEAKRRALELLEIFELKDRMHDKVEDYSSGMRMKLVFARGIIHDPPLILLDEPTVGLDPDMALKFRDYVRSSLHDEQGKTIMLCTHYMAEADYLADRVCMINKGKIVALNTSHALKQELSHEEVISVTSTIELSPENFGSNGASITASKQRGKEWITTIAVRDMKQTYDIMESLRKLEQVSTIEVSQPSLEDVFLKYAGRGLSDDDS